MNPMPDSTTSPSADTTGSALKDSYETLWTTFADEMQEWTRHVKEWAEGEEALHPFLAGIQRVPKEQLQAAVWIDTVKPNIGSATGLFFEHAAAAAIEGRIRAQVEGSASHRNHLGTHVAGTGARKQPDLILVNEATGRAVVFEFKTSPKSPDLGGMLTQKSGWETDPNVRFFLVAGFADGTVTGRLAGYDWAAVLRPTGGDASEHTVDMLVDAAVRHLTAA